MKESIFNRIDKELWQEMQDNFAKEIEFPVLTVDIDGNIIASSNKFPFICSLLQKNESLCRKEWLLNLNKAKDKEGVYIFQCKSGLFNVLVPLKLYKKTIGAVISCSIKLNESNKDYKKLADQLGIESNELIDSFTEVKKIDKDQLNKIGELLQIFANTIPVIAKKSFDSSKKNYELDILINLLTISQTKKRLEEVAKAIISSLISVSKALDCSIILNLEQGTKKFSYRNDIQIGLDNEKSLLAKIKKPCGLVDVSEKIGLKTDAEHNTVLAISLENNGKDLGAILLYGSNVKNIEEKDLTFYAVLAQQISLIITNSLQYEEIENLAIKDKLTGVYNRRYFMEKLEKEINSQPISLMLIDIDNFGNYNNQYGHQEGDILLKEAGNILNKNTRIVDCIGRYGGEEFIILLPNTKPADASAIAERIRVSIAETNFKEQVTVSIGLISSLSSKLKSEELIKEADKALYQAKNQGKNRIIKKVIIDKNMSRYDL